MRLLSCVFAAFLAFHNADNVSSTFDYAVYFDHENVADQSNPLGDGFRPRKPDEWKYVDTEWPIFTDWEDALKDNSKFKKQGNLCGIGKWKTHRQSPVRLQNGYACKDRHAFENPDKGKCKRDQPTFRTTPYGLFADMSSCQDKFEVNVSYNHNDWELMEIVVKTPAEHSIKKQNGKVYYYDGEIQMAYRGTGSSERDILIISVLMKEGDDEKDKDWELEKYIDQWESYQEKAYKSCGKYFNLNKCLAVSGGGGGGDDKCKWCTKNCDSKWNSSSKWNDDDKWESSSKSAWQPSDDKWVTSSSNKWESPDDPWGDDKWGDKEETKQSDDKWGDDESNSKWISSNSWSDDKGSKSKSTKDSNKNSSKKKHKWSRKLNEQRKLRIKNKNAIADGKILVRSNSDDINTHHFVYKRQQELERLVWEQQQELRRLKRGERTLFSNETDHRFLDVTMEFDESAVESVSRLLGDYNAHCDGDSAYCPPNLYKHTGTKYYYRYKGSLTVPPCSEIVDWRVMNQPLIISPEQLKAIRRLQARHIYDKSDASVPPQKRCISTAVGRTIKSYKELCEVGVNRPRQDLTKAHELQKCSSFRDEKYHEWD